MPGDCRKAPGVPMSLLPNQQSPNEEDGALCPTRAHEKDELWLLSLTLGLSFPCVCSQNNSVLSGLHSLFSVILPLPQFKLLSPGCSGLCLSGSPLEIHQDRICRPGHSQPLVHPQPNLTHSA